MFSSETDLVRVETTGSHHCVILRSYTDKEMIGLVIDNPVEISVV